MSGIERLTTAMADRYRIERELGQGGMATVYLADDLRHRRKVAVKVLRPELAAVIGAERFLKEIETTAALQHPHILPLFDSGEVNGTVFYVMPYVEGESLRDRLDREKQLPVSDAVRIATEVASALDYAHRHGVIHRDIKPENILLHDGSALVADFGIALAASTAGGTRMTETGMSLGTPHYMSPEQAMGEREIGPRSDVYALGCVTYEMLVGEPPFTGPTAQAIVAKVMTTEATPVAELRKTVPDEVDAAVSTALQKLPADRFPTAAAFADALAGKGVSLSTGRRASQPRAQRRPALTALAWAGWGVAAVVAGALLWQLRPQPTPVSRFAVDLPGAGALGLSMLGTHLAVSRDGGTLVYTGSDSGGGKLWVKRRDALTATPIPGTEGAYDPCISPDGREVAFITDRDGRSLRVVALAGGPPRTVAGAPLGTSGAYWAPDGYIYFDADVSGLDRVRPDGTGRESVMKLDQTKQEIGIAWPQVLPGGKVIIFRLRHANDPPADFAIAALRLDTGERRTLTRGVSALYAAGRLLFVTADGTLMYAPFDQRTLTLTGPAAALASGIRIAGTYAGVDLGVAGDGTLYYVAGPTGAGTRLEWVSRDGTAQPVDPAWSETGEIRGLALSPDGRRAALEIARAGTTGTDIWLKELPTGRLTRLTLDPASDIRPSWTADGRSVIYVSDRAVPQSAFEQSADGTGGEKRLGRSARDLFEVAESPDGKWLVGRTSSAQAGAGDIVDMRIGQDTAFRTIIGTPSVEANPALSPDGRWLAYTSAISGRREVYVRPFPDVDRGVWQISTDGAVEPRWSRSGKELFFRAISTLDMMAVDVQTEPSFHAGAPRRLFHSDAGTGIEYARYDVAPDGRFLMVGQGGDGARPLLVRVEGFVDDLSSQPTK